MVPADSSAAAMAAASEAERFTRTGWRRWQRRSAAAAARGALWKQRELLLELLAERANKAGGGELEERLALIAPVLQAGLMGVEAPTRVKQRRNAAAHCFQVPASLIAVASGCELNRIQRSGACGRGERAMGKEEDYEECEEAIGSVASDPSKDECNIYEEGMITVATVRDFSTIFDAYSQFEESLLSAKMEAAAEVSSGEIQLPSEAQDQFAFS